MNSIVSRLIENIQANPEHWHYNSYHERYESRELHNASISFANIFGICFFGSVNGISITPMETRAIYVALKKAEKIHKKIIRQARIDALESELERKKND